VLIRNVTKKELYWALAQANANFDNNLTFKSIKQAPGRTRLGNEKWNAVLSVRDCHGGGGRFYRDSGRHVKAACWHAHGTFYDALPQERERNVEIITSAGGNYVTMEKVKIRPGLVWNDWETSHLWRGRSEWASVCCHCGYDGFPSNPHHRRPRP